MAFGKSANRWVTGHAGNRIKKTRDKECVGTHARGDEGGLRTSMATPYNDDVIFVFHGNYYTIT